MPVFPNMEAYHIQLLAEYPESAMFAQTAVQAVKRVCPLGRQCWRGVVQLETLGEDMQAGKVLTCLSYLSCLSRVGGGDFPGSDPPGYI